MVDWINIMCEEAENIADTIQRLIDLVPEDVDTHNLERLKQKAWYSAPEICRNLWQKLYTTLRHNYDTGEYYQHKMCEEYNKGYKDYLRKFIKESI